MLNEEKCLRESCWGCIISCTLFALLWKLCWAAKSCPAEGNSSLSVSGSKWRGSKMTDTAKVKKGKVGGDDVGSEDTERLEPDNSQYWWVSMGRCSRFVCGTGKETGPSSGPYGLGILWTLTAACWFLLPSRSLNPSPPLHKASPHPHTLLHCPVLIHFFLMPLFFKLSLCIHFY